MKKLSGPILTCILLISLFSCATRDEVVYFQPAEDIEGMQNLMDYEPVIEENDVLRINVSSRDEVLVKPFQTNLSSQGSGGGSGGQNLSLTGYLVDPEGFIQFPVLGQVKAKGKTRTELEQQLQSQIRNMVTDAVVSVRIVNFKITVLGEVSSPGRIEVTDGRITLPQLIADAGDISYGGERENILVVREKDGVKSYGRVDLTSADVFNNPYYYLKQNDIVYVEPNYKTIKSAGFITSYTGLISIGTTILSIVLLLTR